MEVVERSGGGGGKWKPRMGIARRWASRLRKLQGHARNHNLEVSVQHPQKEQALMGANSAPALIARVSRLWLALAPAFVPSLLELLHEARL